MFKLMKKINPIVFFLSLCVGLFICYITTPSPDIIYKYPTPENLKLLTYIDEASNCYKYSAKKIPCPKNEKDIKEFPIP